MDSASVEGERSHKMIVRMVDIMVLCHMEDRSQRLVHKGTSLGGLCRGHKSAKLYRGLCGDGQQKRSRSK